MLYNRVVPVSAAISLGSGSAYLSPGPQPIVRLAWVSPGLLAEKLVTRVPVRVARYEVVVALRRQHYY
jgi:hypothetical protein